MQMCLSLLRTLLQLVSFICKAMAPKIQRKPACAVRKRPAIRVKSHRRNARPCGLKYKVPKKPVCQRCGHLCPLCNAPQTPAPPLPAPKKSDAAGEARPQRHVDAIVTAKVE